MKFVIMKDGTKVSIGSHVGFKSDYEQSGKVIAIHNTVNGPEFTLEDKNGFGGEYLRYETTCKMLVIDCWTD